MTARLTIGCTHCTLLGRCCDFCARMTGQEPSSAAPIQVADPQPREVTDPAKFFSVGGALPANTAIVSFDAMREVTGCADCRFNHDDVSCMAFDPEDGFLAGGLPCEDGEVHEDCPLKSGPVLVQLKVK